MIQIATLNPIGSYRAPRPTEWHVPLFFGPNRHAQLGFTVVHQVCSHVDLLLNDAVPLFANSCLLEVLVDYDPVQDMRPLTALDSSKPCTKIECS